MQFTFWSCRRSAISFREFAEEEGGVISISTVPRFKICVPHALVVKYIVHTQTHAQAVNGETAQRPCRWKLRPCAFGLSDRAASVERHDTVFSETPSEVCRRGCTGESTSTAKRAHGEAHVPLRRKSCLRTEPEGAGQEVRRVTLTLAKCGCG